MHQLVYGLTVCDIELLRSVHLQHYSPIKYISPSSHNRKRTGLKISVFTSLCYQLPDSCTTWLRYCIYKKAEQDLFQSPNPAKVFFWAPYLLALVSITSQIPSNSFHVGMKCRNKPCEKKRDCLNSRNNLILPHTSYPLVTITCLLLSVHSLHFCKWEHFKSFIPIHSDWDFCTFDFPFFSPLYPPASTMAQFPMHWKDITAPSHNRSLQVCLGALF